MTMTIIITDVVDVIVEAIVEYDTLDGEPRRAARARVQFPLTDDHRP